MWPTLNAGTALSKVLRKTLCTAHEWKQSARCLHGFIIMLHVTKPLDESLTSLEAT